MRTLLLILTTALLALPGFAADSKFRDGDMFELVVGGAPREFTEEFRLQYTIDGGSVNIQYIGRVQATGLTPTQVAAAVESRLKSEKIFTNPTVLVNRIQTQASTPMFVIGGAVRNSGRLPWFADMTLTQAFAAASGLADFADDKVKVIRAGKVEVFSRKAIKKDPALDPKIQPGDFIEVLGEF